MPATAGDLAPMLTHFIAVSYFSFSVWQGIANFPLNTVQTYHLQEEGPELIFSQSMKNCHRLRLPQTGQDYYSTAESVELQKKRFKAEITEGKQSTIQGVENKSFLRKGNEKKGYLNLSVAVKI